MPAVSTRVKMEEMITKYTKRLEFDENMSTKDIVQNMKEILEKYFRFNYGQYEINVDNKLKIQKEFRY